MLHFVYFVNKFFFKEKSNEPNSHAGASSGLPALSSTGLPTSRLQYQIPDSLRSSASHLKAPASIDSAHIETGNFGLGSKLPSSLNIRATENNGPGSYETFSKAKSGSNLLKQRLPSSRLLYQAKHIYANSPVDSFNQVEVDDNNDVIYEPNDASSGDNGSTGHYESNYGSEEQSNGSHIEDTDYSDLDIKVKEALNLPEIKFNIHLKNDDDQSSNSSCSSGSPRVQNSEQNKKFIHLFGQLSSTEIQPAYESLEHLNFALKEHQKYFQYLEPKVDQLIILCNKQYRLFLTKHYPINIDVNCTPEQKSELELKRKQAEMLFRAISCSLNRLFTCPLGKCASRDTLRELFTHLLPYFTEMKDHQNIFSTVNMVLSVLLNGSDPTNLFTALIRMLHDYVGNANTQSPHSDKFLELTMKFLWRVSKFLDRYIADLNIDKTLFESHLFFKSYPRMLLFLFKFTFVDQILIGSWWRINSREDLPLRTIKTLIYLIVQQKGDSILDHFTLIKSKDESELSYYIQKALRQCEQVDKQNHSSSSSKRQNQSTLSNISLMSEGGGGTPKMKQISDSASTTNGKHSKENTESGQQTKMPRATGKCFPLQTRQFNSPELGQSGTIPVFQSETDVESYVEYTATQLDIPLSYDRIRSKQTAPIQSVEDAERAVQNARERLFKFKTFLNGEQQTL